LVGRKGIGIGDGSIGEPKDLDLFGGLEFADCGDEGFGRVGILEDQDEVRAELEVEGYWGVSGMGVMARC
jgi:hypothetical protein